jgi:autotransporter passenger strand-loop-strand repeat protein
VVISSGGLSTGPGGTGTAFSGGTVDVLAGGELAYATVSSGGILDVAAGGSTQHILVSSGGSVVLDGDLTNNFTIVSGGTVSVLSDGVTKGGILSNGGEEDVYGSASGTTVSSGGLLVVEAGGSASGAIVGGTQDVHGSAINETVQSGGLVVVENGGSVSGLQVDSGGAVDVVSGGAVAGAVISGGALEIGSGGLAGDVTFASGASSLLQLDGSRLFAGTIAGFGQSDELDLADIAFNPATTTLGFSESANNLGGTLTVSDGSHVASLALLGQYMAAQFSMASDGHGGTLIGDPSALAANDPGSPVLAAVHR